MFTDQESPSLNAAAGTAPATPLTPEGVVEGLRAMRAQIGEVTPLTPAQRRQLRAYTYTSEAVLQASINAIGASDLVSQAVGTPAAEVRELFEEANRWTAVEDELRAMLNGIAGANVIRRQRVAITARHAAGVSAQLARNPAHAALVPHVQEIKRLKSFKRRKKVAEAPPVAPSPVPGTSGTPKT